MAPNKLTKMNTETKTISLPSGDLMLFGLPSGAVNIEVNTGQSSTAVKYIWPQTVEVQSFEGTWTALGFLSQVTEDVARGIVEPFMHPNPKHTHDGKDRVLGYENYTLRHRYTNTALESLHSLVEANGWYKENPYGAIMPSCYCHDNFSNRMADKCDVDKEDRCNFLKKRWNEAQQKVNPYLIWKMKD